MRYSLWNKIFGIGLGKTATTSLTDALGLLGYRILHYERPDLTVREDGLRLRWLYLPADGGTDITVAAIFERLDRLFPNSRFVYTERGAGPWLASLHRHYALRGDQVAPAERELRIRMYGTDAYEPARLRQAYDDHHHRVLDYFANRPERLLRLRICDGEGWEKLCPFVDRPVPEAPFPHSNRNPTVREPASNQHSSE